MQKIVYSYIFNEDFNRIVECFTNENISFPFTFKNLITNFKLIKGDHLNEENTVFLIHWKNYYEITFVVEKIIEINYFKSFIIRSINIDKIPIQIILLFSFYLDSIDEKTIFILELKFQDIFFADLIKYEFNDCDKLNICKNIENYLSISLKGLEKNYSCFINASLEEAWKYVSNPKLFYEKIISKDMTYVLKEGQVNLETPVELFTKSDNSPNLIPLTTLHVKTINISDFYAELTYISIKSEFFPSIQLTIKINKIDNNKCFGTIIIKPLEKFLSYPMYCKVFKFWKKRAMDFLKFFEKKSKTNNIF